MDGRGGSSRALGLKGGKGGGGLKLKKKKFFSFLKKGGERSSIAFSLWVSEKAFSFGPRIFSDCDGNAVPVSTS